MQSLLPTLLLCFVMTTPAAAFEGRILSAQGTPIAGAEVTILGRTGSARTDHDGRFTWTPDPPPPFEVLVIAPGGVYMKPLLVERLGPGVLELIVMPLVDEVVTVSGSAASIERTPAAATATLTAVEIQTRTPANLIQALENVPGITQVSEGHAAVPAVRGLARGRTLILVDGARVSSERRVGPSATYLDPDVVEGIEVARGPGSVAYGSDAFGGIISVRTRSVAPASPFRLRFSGTLGAGIPDRRAALEVSQGVARGGVLFAAHARDVDDYRGPTGTVLNSGYADRGLLGRVTYQIGRGLFSAGWQSDFGRDVERPRNNSHVVRFYYPTEDSHRLTTGYDLRDVGGFSRVTVTGFLGRYAQTTHQDRFATAATPRAVERADVRANDFHVRVSTERPVGTSRLEMGVDTNGRFGLHALDVHESYALSGALVRAVETVSVDSARRTDTGVYASIETALMSALSVAGGLRGDYVTTQNRGGFFGRRSTAHTAGSGYVAATVGNFAGFNTTVQLARGFRDPVLSDRYFSGPTGRGSIIGNPDLAPESSLQFDVGLRHTSPRFRSALYAYQYRIEGLIERYQDRTDLFLVRNRGRARLRGLEAEVQGTVGRGMTIEAAFQIARGRSLSDSAYLDDVTPETLSVQMRRDFRARRAFVRLRGAWFADDPRPGPTERVAPGYVLVDLAGGATLARGLDLRVSARNLLHAEYLASQDVRAVLAPGRSVSVSAVVRFGGQ
jgi:outer membrane receptor protein involved in Fe transport